MTLTTEEESSETSPIRTDVLTTAVQTLEILIEQYATPPESPVEKLQIKHKPRPILDSIASILSDEVHLYAVGLIITPHEPNPITILVAETACPTMNPGASALPSSLIDARDFLRDMAPLLHTFQTEREAAGMTDDVEAADWIVSVSIPVEGATRALVYLVDHILARTWMQMSRNLPASHVRTFCQVASVLEGGAALNVNDFPEPLLQHVKTLSEASGLFRSSHGSLRDSVVALSEMRDQLWSSFSDHERGLIRTSIAVIYEVYMELQKEENTHIVEAWNAVTRYYTQGNEEDIISNPFDLLRWLHGTASIVHDIRQLTVATSLSSFSYPFILSPPPQVLAVPANSAGQHIQRAADVSEHDVRRLVADVTGTSVKPSDLDRFTEAFKLHESDAQEPPIHAEITLIIAMYGHPVLPYIGLSHPICSTSDLFLDAYRSETGLLYGTRKGRRETNRWGFPGLESLSGVDDVEDREELYNTFRELFSFYMKKKLEDLWDSFIKLNN
ncbi:hypothetical protein DL93DRAFT_2232440 [Clavulina sp. PMI_390]|nr:hypothetical protein DL93DRAFT_2232440 [Clavulina sp. PMI_390]